MTQDDPSNDANSTRNQSPYSLSMPLKAPHVIGPQYLVTGLLCGMLSFGQGRQWAFPYLQEEMDLQIPD